MKNGIIKIDENIKANSLPDERIYGSFYNYSYLFESAKLVLNFIRPLLVDGTIIIFDDWYTFKGNPNLGEQHAFKEWLDNNPGWIATQYHKEGVWCNSFILNKNISSD